MKYKKFIKKGLSEPLWKLPFHGHAPIKRLSMLSKKLVPQSNTHVAVHFVNAKKQIPQYSFLHQHNYDEINLILSQTGKLIYKIQLNDEIYKVASPSTIFIPKGTRHCANVISGNGIFVCIILSDRYRTK